MVKYADYNVALKNLETWLDIQFYLPVIETEVLLRFINATDGDLDETKRLIDLQYVIRSNQSHIFLDRDPLSQIMRKMFDTADYLSLPGQTPEGGKISVFRLADYDVDSFNHNELTKLFFIFVDLRMSISDPDGIPKGEITIFDAKGFSLKHLARLNLATLRVFMRFVQEAASFKIKDIHIINCPPFLDKIVAVIKPFISAEIFKLIQFHQPDTETLFDWVPKDLLPEDYGGKANVAEIRKETFRFLTEKRNYLTDKKYWVIDEKKRPSNQPRPDVMEGNFRSLNFD